jgi:UDP:flavonoid glycosyltransferase YjiC (YdhE family)
LINDLDMRRKAAELGDKLQNEDGVGKAVGFIQEFLSAPD